MTDWRTEFDEALLRVYSYTHLDNRCEGISARGGVASP